MPNPPTCTEISTGIWRVVYDDNKRFFCSIDSRDEPNERTIITPTLLLDTTQSEPNSGDWEDQEVIYDDDLKTSEGDPIQDLIYWILRYLGRRYGRPF